MTLTLKKFIDGYKNYNLKDTLKNSDIVFIAINHSIFKKKQIMKYARKIQKSLISGTILKLTSLFKKMKRILITGAGGFIGRELVNQLSKIKKIK